MRWEETKTVRPSAASPMRRLRTQWIPSGSRPLTGSSSITVFGSPRSAWAMPRRWPMPGENWPDAFGAPPAGPPRHAERKHARARARHLVQADEGDDLQDAALRDPVRLGEREEMVVRRPPGVDGARLEERADLVQRGGGLAIVAAVHGDIAARRRVEAEDQTHRRRLA